MEIKLENINIKINENYIFNNINLSIPTKKIIGIYGNHYIDFINLLKNKELETGNIIDNGILDNMLIIDDYDSFITNIVLDELYLNIPYNQAIEKEIIEILKRFNLELNFLNRAINTLSNTEKKIIKLIIAMFSTSKTIFIFNLFNGLDYHLKKEFIKLIKLTKNKYYKTIFINDSNMDTIYKLLDKLLIVDTNLVAIDNLEKIFMMEEVKQTAIEYPNFIKIKLMLLDKGINIKNIKNINDLIKEVNKDV